MTTTLNANFKKVPALALITTLDTNIFADGFEPVSASPIQASGRLAETAASRIEPPQSISASLLQP